MLIFERIWSVLTTHLEGENTRDKGKFMKNKINVPDIPTRTKVVILINGARSLHVSLMDDILFVASNIYGEK